MVIRNLHKEIEHPENLVSLTKAYATQADAEREAARMNEINGPKGSRYWVLMIARRSRSQAAGAMLVGATLLGCQWNFEMTLEPGSTAQQVKVRIFHWHHPSEFVRDLSEVVMESCDRYSEIWRLTRVGPAGKNVPFIVTLGQPAPDGWKTTGSVTTLAPGCYEVSASSSAGHGQLKLQVAVDGTVTALLTSRREKTN